MMNRNHEVSNIQMLLNDQGELNEPGWSRHMVQKYDRRMIKAPKWRIKEWDYYLVLSDGFGAAFTISDDGYIGLQSVSLLCFDGRPWQHTETILNAFPMGKLALPQDSSAGVTCYKDKRLQMRFAAGKGYRRIKCCFHNFHEGKTLECDITLRQPDMESMVIATPWDQKHAFYYNQKINCMRASGYMEYDGVRYEFDPETDFGTLDWGRGVWTYDNTWYWGSASGLHEGVPFGFNIGYGFGNTEAASENMLFYDGKAHKLSDVRFHIPGDGTAEIDYLAPWKFTSDDGRFEMDFIPTLDRKSKTDFKVLMSDQHQVFGRFSGTAVLDDGTRLEIRDLAGFAEKVRNKW